MSSWLPLGSRLLTAGLFLLATYFQARAMSFSAAHAACPTWATVPRSSDNTPASELPPPDAAATASAPIDNPEPAPVLAPRGASARSAPIAKLEPSRLQPVASRETSSGSRSPIAGLRFVPERRNDTIAGFRLFGVRPGSVAELVGLRNGDRLESIDGNDLSRPAQAIRAYTRIRSADKVTLELTRGGKRMTLTYNFE